MMDGWVEEERALWNLVRLRTWCSYQNFRGPHCKLILLLSYYLEFFLWTTRYYLS